MVINIWNSDETLAAVVDDFLTAIHTEEINNENTLKASLHVKHPHINLIKEGNYLGFIDADNGYQMFEILETIENHDTCNIYAEHVSCELKYEIVEDVRASDQTAETALNGALEHTRWVTGTVSDFGLASTNFYYESARSALAKIINTWGGEIKYRLAFNGNAITHRYIDLLETRGEESGKRFEYGKDIVDIERQVSLEGVITACYGRGKGEELESGSFGRRLTFENEVWALPDNPANKPIGKKWVGDDSAKALYGYSGRHRFGVFLDDEETNASVLLDKTWDYLQQNNKPRVTYDMDVILLESLSGLKHEKVRLGDIVVINDKELNIAIKAKAIKLERDLLTPELSKIRLGNFINTLSGSLKETEKHIDNFRDKQGLYDDGATRAKDGLTESGYINLPIHGQKIVGTDAEDGLNLTNTHMGYYNDAQSAWRAYIDNTGNFLFQKDANNYFMYDGTNFTFRGPLVADDITAGTLDADRIATKTITGAKLADGTVGNIKIASGISADKMTLGRLQSPDGSAYFDLDNSKIGLNSYMQVEEYIQGGNLAIGTFNTTTGAGEVSLYFARDDEFYPIKASSTISVSGTMYSIAYFFYDINKNLVSSSNTTPATAPTSAYYVRLRFYNGGVPAEDWYRNVNGYVKLYTLISMNVDKTSGFQLKRGNKVITGLASNESLYAGSKIVMKLEVAQDSLDIAKFFRGSIGGIVFDENASSTTTSNCFIGVMDTKKLWGAATTEPWIALKAIGGTANQGTIYLQADIINLSGEIINDKILQSKGTISSDANSYTSNGVYRVAASTNFLAENYPMRYGILTVSSVDAYISQTFHGSDNSFWTRFKVTTNPWQAWGNLS